MIRPILDRVLLRKLKEKQEGSIIKPDAYYESIRYKVVELGDFVILSGQRFPLTEFVNVGDIVLVHQYDVEEIQVEGPGNAAAFETLYLTRVQNIKGKERAVVQGRCTGITFAGEDKVTHAKPSAT